MLNPNKLLKKLENVIHWPRQKYVKVQILNDDNSKSEIEIPKKETDLVMELKYLAKLKKPINEKQWENLRKAIEAYGEECYDKGSMDESMANAGPEL